MPVTKHWRMFAILMKTKSPSGTILSTTMTTTDAGLTQVEFRNCTNT